jgi:type IV pilus assembly protein PilC
MVRAGEESGKLANSLRIIADQTEKNYLLSKKVKGAMIYPAVIVCIMLVIGILMMVFMVPTLTETFIGLNIKLPLPTRVIIAISNFLRSNIILTLVSIIVLAFSTISALKTKKGKDALDYIYTGRNE